MNWRESLGEYIAGVARVWWALVVGVLAGFLGLVSLVANDDPVKWIPTAIYFPLFGLSVVVAQFLAFHEINNQRHALIESSPRVEVVEKHPQAQFFDNGSPIFLLTQVWFRNTAPVPGDASTAKGVSALIEVLDTQTMKPIRQVHGQWDDETATNPGDMGPLAVKPMIDIPPSHVPAKLNVVLRWPNETDCYLFAEEGHAVHPDRRIPECALPKGDYYLRIDLFGVGIRKQFMFFLANGEHLLLTRYGS